MLSDDELLRAHRLFADDESVPFLWVGYMSDGTPLSLTLFEGLIQGAFDFFQRQWSGPLGESASELHGAAGQFPEPPSPEAVAGLVVEELTILDLLAALISFDDLGVFPTSPMAKILYRPLVEALRIFRSRLDIDGRTKELRDWLDGGLWSRLLEQAGQMDHAAAELMAGRAFFGPEGEIMALPDHWNTSDAAA